MTLMAYVIVDNKDYSPKNIFHIDEVTRVIKERNECKELIKSSIDMQLKSTIADSHVLAIGEITFVTKEKAMEVLEDESFRDTKLHGGTVRLALRRSTHFESDFKEIVGELDVEECGVVTRANMFAKDKEDDDNSELPVKDWPGK